MKTTEHPSKFTSGQALEFSIYGQPVKGTFINEENENGDIVITVKVTESFNEDHIGKQLPIQSIFLVTK